jgi:hypothetical protein
MRLELDYKIFPELGTFPKKVDDSDANVMDCRVFWQNEVWVDRNQGVLQLADMTTKELLDVMTYLYDTVDIHYFNILGNLGYGVALIETGGIFVSDEDFVEYNSHVNTMIAAEPYEWLNGTLLMRKIDTLLG